VGFTGWSKRAFTFYEGLEADNSKAYWTANRAVYDADVLAPMEALLGELAEEFGDGKPFRPYRDVRFSADKSPYKTAMGATVARGGYIHLSADGLAVAVGYHMMAPDQLARFRDAIVDDAAGAELERAVAAAEAAGIETFGDTLKTAPRGYPRDHARVGLLRHKALGAGRRLEPGADGIRRDAAVGHARTTWAACAPVCAWLDGHVGPSRAPIEETRDGGRGRGRRAG
jgi:uncharacterized protein (TIGR02453 family)